LTYILGGDWIALVPFAGTVGLIAYITVNAFKPKEPKVEKKPTVNPKSLGTSHTVILE
jgi:hypothetical protein